MSRHESILSEVDCEPLVRHPFFASPRPLVFAHRGGSALAPENTIAAFDNGLALGADGLELDVHLSRDGVVVVHHDRPLDRTTTLRGPIAARTADELRRADVPTLADVLARYRDPRIIIELKVNDAALAAATIDVVRAAGRGRARLPRVVRPARAARGARARAGDRDERARARRCAGRSTARGCRWPVSRVGVRRLSGPGARRDARASSRRASSSTRTTPGSACRSGRSTREDAARRLLGWGVDALITDRPDVIVPLVAGL